MEIDSQDFRDWLGEKLHQSGTRQKEFARAIGYSESAVSAWINGDRRVSDRACVAIALHFGMNVDDIRLLARRNPPGRSATCDDRSSTALIHYTIAHAHRLTRSQREEILLMIDSMIGKDSGVN